MGPLDRIIAVVGIAVLVIAAGSLVYAQESALLDDITYTTHDVELITTETSLDVPAVMLWDNLTGDMEGTPYGASLTVEVRFSGQAFQGGSAPVQLVLTAPNGSTQASLMESLVIAPGATSASTTLHIGLNWTAVPEDHRAISDSTQWLMSYENPLKLQLAIEAPADALAVAADYNFDATVTGFTQVYTQVVL